MKPAAFWLTAGGLGHAPIASGTFGSLPPPALAVLVAIATVAAGRPDLLQWTVNGALVACGLVFAAACVHYGAYAERTWGRKDPGQVVADEVAGQSLTLLALPWGMTNDVDGIVRTVVIAGVGFLAFRFFDILKPPPARGLERLPAGWGVLVDDLAAGVYALAVMQVFTRLVWT